MPNALIDRVRQLWATLAGVEVGSFSVSVPRVVASPDSKICPPGWIGIVAINDAVLITAASPAAAHQLDCRLRALALDEVTDVSALHALLPIVEVLGPAWLSYLAQENLPMRHRPQAVERLPPGHGDLTRLRSAVSQDEADESGLADITSDAFVVRHAGEVISAAGFRRWPYDIAHMSVLTTAPARGNGLATTTACAAVKEALAQDLLPQWRARPASSRRVSAEPFRGTLRSPRYRGKKSHLRHPHDQNHDHCRLEIDPPRLSALAHVLTGTMQTTAGSCTGLKSR
ncbi:MAG: GNAT family N-acetyltransferase [Actinobacteria bacterium]|nr:GNAT family N-acetyltransferase [Actinomycetota bacterium]